MEQGTSIRRWGVSASGVFFAIFAILLAAPRETGAHPDTATQTTTSSRNGVVDVNSANLKTLETLPGVNASLARAIANGRPYHTLTDLSKVKGMTKTKLDSLKGNVTFGEVTTTTKTASKKHKKAATPATASTTTGEEGTTATTSRTSTTTTTPSPTGSAVGKLQPGQTVDINSASAGELQALPGVGPKKAQAIVDYRDQNGRFNSIEDIQKVKGIKKGEFSKIQDYITVK